MGIISPTVADLPDTVVWSLPNAFEMLKQLPLHRPTLVVDGYLAAVTLVKRVDDFAVNVELPLLCRCITDANWSSAVETR